MQSRTLPSVLDSRSVYRGRIFEAVVDRIQMPDREKPFDVEVVRHVRSVGIAAMPAEDALMLVRQYRHAARTWLWELPAGSVDEGERPDETARRECQEELGLVAESIEEMATLIPLPGYCTEEMTFFRLTGLRAPGAGDPEVQQDEDEDIETRAFTFQEVRRMVLSGEIRDLKTVAVVTLLDPR
jgi:ADP-ribose pyrophosphatase